MDTARIIAACAAVAMLMGGEAALSIYERFTSTSAEGYRITDEQQREIAAELPDPLSVRFGAMAVMPRLVSGHVFASRPEARRRVQVCGEVETWSSLRSSPTPMRRFVAEFESSADEVRIGPLVGVAMDDEFSDYARAMCDVAERMR